MAILLALSVSADALACGFGAGASRLKVPFVSAVAAAAVSAAFVAFGMAAGRLSAPLMPTAVQKYISFAVLAVFGLIKLAGGESDTAFADCNCNRRLSVPEGIALGAAISVDGLAAGFGYAADIVTATFSAAFTFAFSCAALYMGAKGGKSVHKGRRGETAAGLVLVFLAAQKLWSG